jgi:hypothetical protein
MSKPIPKKQRQLKAFAKALIPLWPRATWVSEKETQTINGARQQRRKNSCQEF